MLWKQRVPWGRTIALSAVVAFAGTALGGVGGVIATDGTYTFHRTTGTPADVGTGKFEDPKCEVNPGPSAEVWQYSAVTGLYTLIGGTGYRAFCVHSGGTQTYDWKEGGEIQSSGELVK